MLTTLYGAGNFTHTVWGEGCLSYNSEIDITITDYKSLKMLAQGFVTIWKE